MYSGQAVAGRGGAAAEEDGAHGAHGGGHRAAVPARARGQGDPAATAAARRSGGAHYTPSCVQSLSMNAVSPIATPCLMSCCLGWCFDKHGLDARW